MPTVLTLDIPATYRLSPLNNHMRMLMIQQYADDLDAELLRFEGGLISIATMIQSSWLSYSNLRGT